MKNIINIKYIGLMIFISYILISCDTDKKLSNDDKIKILTEIFSDKTKPRLFFKKCIFLNIQLTRPHSMLYNRKDYKAYNEYISEILKVKDTIFISEQITNNKNLKINSLRNFNFKFQNFEDKKTNENCYVMISKPLFNKNEDYFYIIIQENGTQNQYLFKKDRNNWVVDKKFGLAIE